MKKRLTTKQPLPKTTIDSENQNQPYTPLSRELVPLRVTPAKTASANTKDEVGNIEDAVANIENAITNSKDEENSSKSLVVSERPDEAVHRSSTLDMPKSLEGSPDSDDKQLETEQAEAKPPETKLPEDQSPSFEADLLYRAIKQGSLFISNDDERKKLPPTHELHFDEKAVILAPDRILDLEEAAMNKKEAKEKSIFSLAANQEAQPYLPKNAQEAFYLVAPGLNEDRDLMRSMGLLLKDVEPKAEPVSEPASESMQQPENLIRPVKMLAKHLENKLATGDMNEQGHGQDREQDPVKQQKRQEIKSGVQTVSKTQIETTEEASTKTTAEPTTKETAEPTTKEMAEIADASAEKTSVSEQRSSQTVISETELDQTPPQATKLTTDKKAEQIAEALSKHLNEMAMKESTDSAQDKAHTDKAHTGKVQNQEAEQAPKKEGAQEAKPAPKKEGAQAAIQLAAATRAKLLAQNTIQEASGFLYFLCFIPASILFLIQYWYSHNTGHTSVELVISYGLGNLLLYVFSLILPMLVSLKKHNYSYSFIFGKHTLSPASLILSGLISLPVLLLLTGLNHIINYGLIYFHLTNAQMDWLSGTNLLQALPETSSFLLTLVLFGLLEPILEELFFRGFLQSMFSTSNHLHLACFLQALAYALYKPQPLFLIFPLLTGLFLGYLRYSMQSLWPALIGHIVLNLGTFLLYQLLPTFIADPLLVGTKTGEATFQASFITVTLSVLILMPTLRLLRHFQPKHKMKRHVPNIQPTTMVFYLSCLGFLLLKLFL